MFIYTQKLQHDLPPFCRSSSFIPDPFRPNIMRSFRSRPFSPQQPICLPFVDHLLSFPTLFAPTSWGLFEQIRKLDVSPPCHLSVGAKSPKLDVTSHFLGLFAPSLFLLGAKRPKWDVMPHFWDFSPPLYFYLGRNVQFWAGRFAPLGRIGPGRNGYYPLGLCLRVKEIKKNETINEHLVKRKVTSSIALWKK